MSTGFPELDMPDLSAFDGAFFLRDIQLRHGRQLRELGIVAKALPKIQTTEGPAPTSVEECNAAVFRKAQESTVLGGILIRATFPDAPPNKQQGEFYTVVYRQHADGVTFYRPFGIEDAEAIQGMVSELEQHEVAGHLPSINGLLTNIVELPQL